MKKLLMFFALVLIAGLVISCSSEATKTEEPTAPEPEIVDYTIVDKHDVSYSTVKRYSVKVIVPEDVTETDIMNVAKEIINNIKSEEKVNAIGFLFYNEGDNYDWIYTVAKMDWAPDGDWGSAGDVDAGNYSKHKFGAICFTDRVKAEN